MSETDWSPSCSKQVNNSLPESRVQVWLHKHKSGSIPVFPVVSGDVFGSSEGLKKKHWSGQTESFWQKTCFYFLRQVISLLNSYSTNPNSTQWLSPFACGLLENASEINNNRIKAACCKKKTPKPESMRNWKICYLAIKIWITLIGKIFRWLRSLRTTGTSMCGKLPFSPPSLAGWLRYSPRWSNI